MDSTRKNTTKYKDKRWYVLFVKSDGRTVPIRHFKGMVWAGIFFGAALLTLIGVLLFFYSHQADEKTALERMVSSHEHEKAVIQKEKDSLMAQLAIAESKLKISMAECEGSDDVADADPVEAPPEPVESINAKVTEIPGKKLSSENKGDIPAQNLKTVPAIVSVDNFLACYDPDAARVYVEFKVINIGKKRQPVSGYAYTVLKDGKEEKNGWLIFPKTQLDNGVPVQTKGMRFRIYNFRTMKFSVQHNNPDKFTNASVFVYQQDTSKLILERDFEITMIPTCP